MGAEQSGFALKKAAEHAGEGEYEVAVGDGVRQISSAMAAAAVSV